MARIGEQVSERQRKTFAMRRVLWPGIVVAGALLSGCATNVADAPLIGVPANAPARPGAPTAYLPVHDVPPPREEAVPTDDERARLQKELLAARDRQNAQADALTKQRAK